MNVVHHIAAVQSVTTKSGARHLALFAALIGGLGALSIMLGAGFGLRWIPGGGDDGRAERIAYIVGGLLIGVGFLSLIIAIHNGFGSVTVR